MAGSRMRSPNPVENIREIESNFNNSEPSERLRAASRIFNIGEAAPSGSRIREAATAALLRGFNQENDEELRGEFRSMLQDLGHTGGGLEPAPLQNRMDAVPRRVDGEGLAQRAMEFAGTALVRATLRRLSPLALIPLTSSCAPQWPYEDSRMFNETHLVRDFTENLVSDCETDYERLVEIIRWGQANLPHFHGRYGGELYGSDDANVTDPTNVSVRDVFRERVVGCHLAVYTLATMLRSVGIDATYMRTEDFEGLDEGHGILYVPEFERYVHGDRVCLTNLLPTEDIIQTEEGLSTQEYMENSHSGGLLRRDGNHLFIEGGVVHAGYEDTEFQRLRQMFPMFEFTVTRRDDFGSWYTTNRARIEPLD
jgi:hypothetical protein